MTGDEKILSPDDKRSKIRKTDYAYMRELRDPCIKEHELTMKCLDDSGYDRDKCNEYFVNYRICRKFWTRVEKDRKRKGITPTLPLPADRDAVRKENLRFLDKPSS